MVKIWSKPLDFQIFVGACAPPNFYVAPPESLSKHKKILKKLYNYNMDCSN